MTSLGWESLVNGLSFVDVCGFVAAGLTLATFAHKAILPMRLTALFASAFFVLYGWLGPFYPILVLHVPLLPINAVRLRDVLRGELREPTGRPSISLLDEWRAARH